MNNLHPGIVLGATAIKELLTRMPDTATLEERCQLAMTKCRDEDVCFMCSTDDQIFKAGVGGLLLFYAKEPAIKARIERELRLLASLTAAMSGVPADLAAAFGDEGEAQEKPLGLLGMFRGGK